MKTVKKFIRALVRKWQYETGNGFVSQDVHEPLNPQAMNRQHTKQLKLLTKRWNQLLGEADQMARDLATLEYQEQQGYLHATVTFDSMLNWGDPVTLHGSDEVRGYSEKLNLAISALATFIERDTLGSDAELSATARKVSVVRA